MQKRMKVWIISNLQKMKKFCISFVSVLFHLSENRSKSKLPENKKCIFEEKIE